MIGRFLFSLLIVSALATPVRAQTEGVFHVTDWPSSAIEAGLLSETALEKAPWLPYVDTLSVGYVLSSDDGRPHLHLMIEWQPGRYGLLDGSRVRRSELPDDMRLQALELHAEVQVGGQPVADFWLPLDDLDLGARPDVYRTEIDDLDWTDLFPGLEPDTIETMLRRGVTLTRPALTSASFTSDASFYTQTAGRPERDRPDRRRQPEPTVVVMDPGVWVDIWILSPPHVRDPYRPRPTRDATPRGARGRDGDVDSRSRGAAGGRTAPDGSGNTDSARTDSSRSGRGMLGDLLRGGRSQDDDEDEEDDDDQTLAPAALVGVAAVGVLAAAGGSVGYYGNMREAPIGLEAGYVRRGGGVLAQVAVNEAVIADRDAPERLIAKLTGFYDAFDHRLQPAMGIGVYAEQYRNDLDVEPSLTLGAVYQHDALLFYAGYDVAAGGLDLGVAFNFRHR